MEDYMEECESCGHTTSQMDGNGECPPCASLRLERASCGGLYRGNPDPWRWISDWTTQMRYLLLFAAALALLAWGVS